MCEICRQSICPAGCPNASEPPKVYNCEQCGEGIYEGEEFVKIEGSYYHRDCFDEEWEDILWRHRLAETGVAET